VVAVAPAAGDEELLVEPGRFGALLPLALRPADRLAGAMRDKRDALRRRLAAGDPALARRHVGRSC